MRMLKLITAAALSVCLLTALTGCQERLPAEQSPSSAPVSTVPTEPPVPTPAELMKIILEKNADIPKGIEGNWESMMELNMTGISMKFGLSGKGASIGDPESSPEDYEGIVDIKVTVLGQDISMGVYAKGMDAYMTALGQKIKMNKADVDSTAEIVYDLDDWKDLSEMLQAGEKSVTDAKVEKTDNGYTFSCRYLLNSMLDELEDSVQENAGQSGIDWDKELSGKETSFILKTDEEGRLLSYDLSIEVNVQDDTEESDDNPIKVSMSLHCDIEKIGSEVVITPPVDLDTYKTEEELSGVQF